MIAICLALTTALVAAALGLFALSFRRPDAYASLAGMTALLVACIPACTYATLTS